MHHWGSEDDTPSVSSASSDGEDEEDEVPPPASRPPNAGEGGDLLEGLLSWLRAMSLFGPRKESGPMKLEPQYLMAVVARAAVARPRPGPRRRLVRPRSRPCMLESRVLFFALFDAAARRPVFFAPAELTLLFRVCFHASRGRAPTPWQRP